MKKININFKELLDNDRFLWIFSLLAALVAWYIVIDSTNDSKELTIYNVPVTLNIAESSLSKLGLDEIEEQEHKVSVAIYGPRSVVGNVKASDIEVTASLTGVTTPGLHELRLEGSDKNNLGFQVSSITPATISVQFDRMVSKKLPVQVDISGVSFPEGYLMEKEYVTPAEINVTGPEADISKIYKCVAKADIDNKTLTSTEVIRTKIELMDKDGNLIDSKFITTDYSTVEITVPILKVKEVPLKIQFLNVPQSFPLDELEYTFSTEVVTVAGPQSSIDNMEEINLGYIDMKDLDIDSPYTFDIVLPSGYVNVDDITTVEVSFENEELTSRYFTVSDIRVVNKPANYDVTVSTKNITGVRVIGRKTVLDTMTAGDLVAEIDLSGYEVNEGQTKVPVNIIAPTKGLVWANGSYQAQVVIRGK